MSKKSIPTEILVKSYSINVVHEVVQKSDSQKFNKYYNLDNLYVTFHKN